MDKNNARLTLLRSSNWCKHTLLTVSDIYLNPMFRAHPFIFSTKDSTTFVLSILNTIWDLEYFGWWTTFRPSEEDWFLRSMEKGEA